jgi:ATP-dependent Clp endopeptidase proteolytic subunit ClpP
MYSGRKRKCYFGRKYRNDKNKDDDDNEYNNDDKGIGLGVLNSLMNKNIDVIGNHIWFNDDVSNSSISKLIKLIGARNFAFSQEEKKVFYGKLVPKPIYLHINSCGGDLQEGMAAVDAIRNSKIPIYTIIEGEAASAATFLSVAGQKRFMTENSVLLIHQLSAGCWGTMQELEDDHKNNKFFMEKIYSLYSKYTTISRRSLEKIMKHDIWWDVKTAMKYGFVDEIYYGEVNEN